MSEKTSQYIFLVSLIALFFYFNTCRRLLVSTAPVFLSKKLISEEFYGFLSSTTSILFGVCRFVAYSLLDWFSVDSYVTILTIGSCCVCMMLSFFSKSLDGDHAFIVLGICFILLFLFVGLPFPSSSIIIGRYFAGKERNFVWSLLSISSCIGSIIAATLCYYVKDPSAVFSYVTHFGISCIILFYVFFPSTTIQSEEKKGTESKASHLSKSQEMVCLILCFVSYFLIYLSRRIISEWSSLYTMELFELSEEDSHSMFTTTNNLYEIASILSLLLFGVLTFTFSSVDLSLVMSVYITCSLFGSILPQIASSFHFPWLNYVASFVSGFFISVPYASLDLVIMDICTTVKVSRALSLTSLLSQVAAAVAGYPVYQFFTHICSFRYTPIVLTCLLVSACICLWTIYSIKSSVKKEKSD